MSKTAPRPSGWSVDLPITDGCWRGVDLSRLPEGVLSLSPEDFLHIGLGEPLPFAVSPFGIGNAIMEGLAADEWERSG